MQLFPRTDTHLACKPWKSFLLWRLSIPWRNYAEQQSYNRSKISKRLQMSSPRQQEYNQELSGGMARGNVFEKSEDVKLERSLCPRQQTLFLIWNRIQESRLPVSHRIWQPRAAPYSTAHIKGTCTDQLLHSPCIHHFDFCFLWQHSKNILQTFTGPCTHNPVKNIVQALFQKNMK